MANPLGRPRGKGPGKYTKSPASESARRANVKKPRPGRRKPTDSEKERAYEADRIGRTLCLEVVEQASEYLKVNRQALKDFEAAIADPDVSVERIEALAEARMSPGELTRMLEAVHNRWGQPPRSVMEVAAAERVPALFEVPLTNWQSREGAHAAGAAAGNGHGNGHTEH